MTGVAPATGIQRRGTFATISHTDPGKTTRTLLYGSRERPILLFGSEWSLRTADQKREGVRLHDIAL